MPCDGSPAAACWAMMIRRASGRSAGSRQPNTTAPTTQTHAAARDRGRRADPVRKRPGEQRAERRHPHEHHRVDGHHPARAARRAPSTGSACSTTPSAASCRSRSARAAPPTARAIVDDANSSRLTPKPAAASATHRPRPRMPVARGEQAGSRQRAQPGGPHQQAERLRAAVQDPVGEHRHQHRVRHPREAHEPEHQQQRADRRRARHVPEPFDDVRQRRTPRARAGTRRRGASAAARRSPPRS